MYYQKTTSEKEMRPKLTTPLKAVAGLNLIQGAMRLMFFYIMITGGIDQFLEVEINPSTLQAISIIFLVLGVASLISIYGFIKRTGWGVKAILAVNVLTILFDIWGYLIQQSAFLGFIVPGATFVILAIERKHLEVVR